MKDIKEELIDKIIGVGYPHRNGFVYEEGSLREILGDAFDRITESVREKTFEECANIVRNSGINLGSKALNAAASVGQHVAVEAIVFAALSHPTDNSDKT